jgi:hypothetical protein
MRSGLSAIGVAPIVAVLGLWSSSAALNAEIAALGTNLLTVQQGRASPAAVTSSRKARPR